MLCVKPVCRLGWSTKGKIPVIDTTWTMGRMEIILRVIEQEEVRES